MRIAHMGTIASRRRLVSYGGQTKIPEQKPNKPTEEEIKKAAEEMAVFLYDLYQAEKTKKSKK